MEMIAGCDSAWRVFIHAIAPADGDRPPGLGWFLLAPWQLPRRAYIAAS